MISEKLSQFISDVQHEVGLYIILYLVYEVNKLIHSAQPSHGKTGFLLKAELKMHDMFQCNVSDFKSNQYSVIQNTN